MPMPRGNVYPTQPNRPNPIRRVNAFAVVTAIVTGVFYFNPGYFGRGYFSQGYF